PGQPDHHRDQQLVTAVRHPRERHRGREHTEPDPGRVGCHHDAAAARLRPRRAAAAPAAPAAPPPPPATPPAGSATPPPSPRGTPAALWPRLDGIPAEL